MQASKLIEKLQEEMRKYGDLPVVAHATDSDGQGTHGEIADVATFTSCGTGRRIWVSSEEA